MKMLCALLKPASFAAAVFLAAQHPCDAAPADGLTPPSALEMPPSTHLRIAVSRPVPQFSCPVPSAQKEAIRKWAAEFALPEGEFHVHPRMLAGQIARAPLGAIVGAAVGATVGMPEHERTRALSTLDQARVTLRDADIASSQFVAALQNERSWKVASGEIPKRAEPPLQWANALDARRKSKRLNEPDAPLARFVSNAETTDLFDTAGESTSGASETLLEVTVLRHGLTPRPKRCLTYYLFGREMEIRDSARARMTLSIEWHLRLIRASDGAELWSAYPRYDGGEFTFSQWTANSGRLLCAELTAAYRELGERIASRLSAPPAGEMIALHSTVR